MYFFQNIIRRLASEILPMADQIMMTLLHVLSTASRNSTVIEDSFIVVSAMAGGDFKRLISSSVPYLTIGYFLLYSRGTGVC